MFLLVSLFAVGIASAATATCDFTFPGVTVPGNDITCGPVTFTNFVVQPTTPGAPTSIQVTQGMYDAVSNTAYLQFNPGLLNGADVYLYFQVTGINGAMVNGVDMSVSGSNAGATEVVCSTPINSFTNNCAVNTELARFSVQSGGSNNVLFGAPVQTAYVFKDIGTQAGGELSTVTQSFETSSVPEPATFALLGFGLVGFALARRKRA
jgi:hypothetical protein